MLKVSVVILSIVLLYGVVYETLIVVAPKQAVASTYSAVAGGSIEVVKDEGYLDTLTGETRQIGVVGLSSSLLTAFILFAAYRKAQKWAWWAILIGILPRLGFTVMRHIVIGDMMTAYLVLGALVVFLVGILLPVKAFFTNKA